MASSQEITGFPMKNFFIRAFKHKRRSPVESAINHSDLIHADANISGVIGFAAFGIRIVVIDDGTDPISLSAD